AASGCSIAAWRRSRSRSPRATSRRSATSSASASWRRRSSSGSTGGTELGDHRPGLRSAPVKVLLITFYFPPAGGGGVQRPLKFATHLPALGVETHVLAPDDPRWIHSDPDERPPSQAWVHRVRYLGPRGRRPAEELHATQGLERATKQLQLFGRRLLVPDENAPFALTAAP